MARFLHALAINDDPMPDAMRDSSGIYYLPKIYDPESAKHTAEPIYSESPHNEPEVSHPMTDGK